MDTSGGRIEDNIIYNYDGRIYTEMDWSRIGLSGPYTDRTKGLRKTACTRKRAVIASFCYTVQCAGDTDIDIDLITLTNEGRWMTFVATKQYPYMQ